MKFLYHCCLLLFHLLAVVSVGGLVQGEDQSVWEKVESTGESVWEWAGSMCESVWDWAGSVGESAWEWAGSADGEESWDENGEKRDWDESELVRERRSVEEMMEEMMEEAWCPDAEDITPCTCTNVTLDTLTMDCSAVTDEDQLSQVFSSFFPVTDFHQLVISHNPYLRILRDGVLGSVTFQHFTVHNGVLESVEDNALSSSYSTASSLVFYHNNLSSFPTLESFMKLTLLDLGFNNLQKFPYISSDTLETLHMNNNPLGVLPDEAFAATPSLASVYLQGTQLQDIPSGAFSGLAHLNEVYLFRNSLSKVSEAAVEFNPAVGGSVFLSMNNITTVAVNAFPGVSERVELQINNLTEVHEEVFRPLLEAGVTILLHGNPLVCGCDIAWLLQNRTFFGLIDPMFTRCSDGQLVALLDPADFDQC